MHKTYIKYLTLIFFLFCYTHVKSQTWVVTDTIINNDNCFIYPRTKDKCCWENVKYWLVNDTFRLYLPKDGMWIQFFTEDINKIAKEFEVKDSVLNGSWTEYYFNQEKKRVGEYCNGNQCKEWIEYYETGGIKSIKHYLDGEIDGLTKYFYENGNIEFAGNYKNRERDSLWRYNHENGIMKYNLLYKKGEIINDSLFIFNNNRSIESKGAIDKGLYYGNWNYYYPNGKIECHGDYEIRHINICAGGMFGTKYYSLKQGEWIFYYDTGEILAKANYRIVKRLPPRQSAVFHLFIPKSKLSRLRFYNKAGQRVTMKQIKDLDIIDFEFIKNGVQQPI